MIIDQTTPDEVMWSFLMSILGSASRHWPTSIALTSVFRRRTWHHCATVAAAQSPFYFACWLVIVSHTHASRVNFSAALRFPGSRVACSALQTTVVSRHSSVYRVLPLSLFAPSVHRSLLLFGHFCRIKFRRVINFFRAFSRRPHATIFLIGAAAVATYKCGARRYRQYYTSVT